MNLFAIDLAGGTISKAPKKKAKPRRASRVKYRIIAGKRVRTSPRLERIMRAIAPLKGLDVPPR